MYIVIFIFVGNLAVALVFITHLLWCIMRRGLDEEGINVVKQKLNEQNGAAQAILLISIGKIRRKRQLLAARQKILLTDTKKKLRRYESPCKRRKHPFYFAANAEQN